MRSVLCLLAMSCLLACGDGMIAQQPAPVIVTVDHRVVPGKGDVVPAALEPLLTEVRKEPHYRGITVLRDAQGGPGRILLVERWAAQAYYTGTHSSPVHLEAFKAEAMPLLAGPPAVTMWPRVEEVAKL